MLAGYSNEKVIYQGNHTIYEAIRTSDSRKVAIKETALEDGFHEKTILDALSPHPHIIELLEYRTLQDKAYLVFPFIEVQIHGIYKSPALAKKCAFDLLKTLSYIHSRNVVHLDLKPANILFNGKSVVVIDFERALFQKNLYEADIGTGSYSPPEIHYALGRDFSDKIDVWSVGVILYEWLCGARLFRKTSEGDDDHDYLPQIREFTAFMKREQCFDFRHHVNLVGDEYDNAASLLDGMLQERPKHRFTADECLSKEWFTKAESESKSRLCLRTCQFLFKAVGIRKYDG